MKYLILLLLTFNSFASTKFVMTDLRNGKSLHDTFDTQELAVARLIEIAKTKGWRSGEFTYVADGSLYSKEFNAYNEDGIFTGVETKYYHPLNWSYEFSDATKEVADKEAKKQRKKDLLDQVHGRNGKTKKDLNIRQLNEYFFE